jgi:hypothetical protein
MQAHCVLSPGWGVKALAAFTFLLLAPPPLVSAQESVEIDFGGQIRPRAEGRTPVDGSWNAFTSMRVRAALDASLEGNVGVFIQVQDVRLFGEEESTLTDYSADNFDLHQGFLQLESVPGLGGMARVGRQELALGEQRLVGAVNWTQQGRSFDGIRYTTPMVSGFTFDLFAMKLQEETADTQELDASFLGAYGTLPTGDAGSLDLYGLFTTDSREDNDAQVTVGGLWKGRAGPLDIRLEGSLQTGEREGTSVSAFMVGARAGTRIFDFATATLWYDYLSGDEDPTDDEIGVFSTLFATNHAFYGLADYFLDIPAHTGGLGLRDAAIKVSFDLPRDATLKVDFHDFRTAEEGDLSTQALANELDLTLSYRMAEPLTLVTGYSWVRAREGIKQLERLSEDAQWAYVMLDAVF